jgi:hypothetical protein
VTPSPLNCTCRHLVEFWRQSRAAMMYVSHTSSGYRHFVILTGTHNCYLFMNFLMFLYLRSFLFFCICKCLEHSVGY